MLRFARKGRLKLKDDDGGRNGTAYIRKLAKAAEGCQRDRLGLKSKQSKTLKMDCQRPNRVFSGGKNTLASGTLVWGKT